MNKLAVGLLATAFAAVAAYAAAPSAGMGPGPDATVTKAEAQAHAAQMFDRLDANHDGKLDAADREARQTALFDLIDADHNGQISRSEFAAFRPMAMGHGGAMPPGEGGMGWRHHGMRGGMGGGDMAGRDMGGGGHLMMMARAADTNHDGAVSRDEFLAAHLAHFDKADTNHDGKLSPAERRAAHAAMRGGMDHGDMPHDGMPGGPAMPPPPPGN